MALRQTYIQGNFNWRDLARHQGLTLFEAVISISIITLLATLTFGVDIDTFEHYSFYDERDRVVALLMRARSDAMNGVCYGSSCTEAVSHGVHFEGSRATLFQGNVFNPNDVQNEVHTLRALVSVGGLNEALFHYSGDASTTPKDADLVMSDGSGNVSAISITSVGRVSWTH